MGNNKSKSHTENIKHGEKHDTFNYEAYYYKPDDYNTLILQHDITTINHTNVNNHTKPNYIACIVPSEEFIIRNEKRLTGLTKLPLHDNACYSCSTTHNHNMFITAERRSNKQIDFKYMMIKGSAKSNASKTRERYIKRGYIEVLVHN